MQEHAARLGVTPVAQGAEQFRLLRRLGGSEVFEQGLAHAGPAETRKRVAGSVALGGFAGGGGLGQGGEGGSIAEIGQRLPGGDSHGKVRALGSSADGGERMRIELDLGIEDGELRIHRQGRPLAQAGLEGGEVIQFADHLEGGHLQGAILARERMDDEFGAPGSIRHHQAAPGGDANVFRERKGRDG